MSDEVLNQPPPLAGYDAYSGDAWLKAAVRRANATWIEGAARELGLTRTALYRRLSKYDI